MENEDAILRIAKEIKDLKYEIECDNKTLFHLTNTEQTFGPDPLEFPYSDCFYVTHYHCDCCNIVFEKYEYETATSHLKTKIHEQNLIKQIEQLKKSIEDKNDKLILLEKENEKCVINFMMKNNTIPLAFMFMKKHLTK